MRLSDKIRTIHNRCAHPINVWNNFPQNGGKVVASYPPCAPEEEARSTHADTSVRLGFLDDGAPVVYNSDARVWPPLPPEEPGVYYIVSSIVAALAQGRSDLLTPGKRVKSGGVEAGCLGLITRHRLDTDGGL